MSAGADPARAAIDARVLAWLREPGAIDVPAAASEERFDALARDLFAFQFSHCEPYRRFCEGRGVTPAGIGGWREIPAVPTGAFKELALRSFPPERTHHVFRTSGTATAARGELHLDTLALYEASLLPAFRAHVLPDLASARPVLRVLAPSAAEQLRWLHAIDAATGESLSYSAGLEEQGRSWGFGGSRMK